MSIDLDCLAHYDASYKKLIDNIIELFLYVVCFKVFFVFLVNVARNVWGKGTEYKLHRYYGACSTNLIARRKKYAYSSYISHEI